MSAGDILKTADPWKMNCAIAINSIGANTSWAPTFAASGSMTWTTVTQHHAMYSVVGDWIIGNVYATGTTGGSASTDLTFTLPVAALGAGYCGGGAACFQGGTRIGGFFVNVGSTTVATVSKYDISNWSLAANTGFSLSFAYQWR